MVNRLQFLYFNALANKQPPRWPCLFHWTSSKCMRQINYLFPLIKVKVLFQLTTNSASICAERDAWTLLIGDTLNTHILISMI